ncbi:MAG: hypothetical protein ACYC3O_13670 [Burkholderiales bacterium]
MTPEQSMRIYLTECAVHAEVLEEGLHDASYAMPMSADRLADKALLRILDQIAYRFTKLQDSMGEKILPLILVLAQEPILSSATFAEKLNRLERLGAIPSVEEWKKLRVARNAITHEYPDDPEMRLIAIKRFLDGAANLSLLYRSVTEYIMTHFPGLSAGNDLNGKRE